MLDPVWRGRKGGKERDEEVKLESLEKDGLLGSRLWHMCRVSTVHLALQPGLAPQVQHRSRKPAARPPWVQAKSAPEPAHTGYGSQ